MKYIFCFIIVLATVHGLFSQVALDSGLVALYRFNGNADDSSPFSNDGIAYNVTLAADRSGNLDRAYSFNGTTSYIKVPNSASLNIQNSISLCVWIKTIDPDIYADGNGGFIIGKEYTNGSRAYTLVANDGTLGDSIIFQLFNSSNVQFRTTKNSSYYNDKWHFIVSTYDYLTGMSKIYVDSVLVTTKYIGVVNLKQTTVPFSIGCFWNNSTGTIQRGFFSGRIDDVRVYNRAINHAEVIELYLETVTGTDFQQTDKVTLYPNPNDGTFIVNSIEGSPDDIIVQLFDISGKQVNSMCNLCKEDDKVIINFDGIKTGIYYLSIINKNSRIVKKFVVVK